MAKKFTNNNPYYGDISPVSSGLRGVCPRCARGKLFKGYLEIAKKCTNCELDYSENDAGDGATWFVMLVISFLVVGVALWVEIMWRPSYYVHALVAIPLTFISGVGLLRPVKGMLICQQYKVDRLAHNDKNRY